MELALAEDAGFSTVERGGNVKAILPSGESTIIGKIQVFTGLEDGLLGLALDPHFTQNQHLYLFTPSRPRPSIATARRRVRIEFPVSLSRMASSIFRRKGHGSVHYPAEECCHSGGSVNFDARGNLYASAGDNTNPFASDGYAPIDKTSRALALERREVLGKSKRPKRENSSRAPGGGRHGDYSQGKPFPSRHSRHPA